jgi:anti-sigma factor ChrR (cupin superfamily)
MSAALNGDLSVRVVVDANEMDWAPSPSGTVWRKRLHRVGPAESGQVTSIVRYEPNASFPAHDHPEGEEIFVLEGVFSDEYGDWAAGTYLLNPEGFRHAPFSKNGCILFVKLRQYPGTDRKHHAIDTKALEWVPAPSPGIACKPLYEQVGYPEKMRLERWDAGAETGTLSYPDGAEIYVLDGSLEDQDGRYKAGSWLRFPVGASHRPTTSSGCILYTKLGGVAYLRAAGSVSM